VVGMTEGWVLERYVEKKSEKREVKGKKAAKKRSKT